jgi:hypothetical protein
MLKKETINKVKVTPIKLPQIESQNIRGYDMFPEIYSNVFLCAKKKSGKTCTINHIVRKCVDKRTTVIVFCSTSHKDRNWLEIKKYLEEKEIPHEFHNSIKEDGHDYLAELIDKLQLEVSDDESESEPEPEPEILRFDDDSVTIKLKKRKPKIISQKYLIIFDDLSLELQDKNINHLLKTNRHYKSKVLLSSQYLNDLAPMARRNIDVYILFGGLNEKKLQEIYANADLSIEFNEFRMLYEDATSKKYNFFYCDTNGDYRMNFNERYKI